MSILVTLESTVDQSCRTFFTSPDKPLVIGRESTTTLLPPSHTEARYASGVVSARHAEIRVDMNGPEGQILLVDTNSTHGTTVNGQKLQPGTETAIYPGDLLKFGVRVVKPEGSTEPVSVYYREAEGEDGTTVTIAPPGRPGFTVPLEDDEENESDVQSNIARTPQVEEDADSVASDQNDRGDAASDVSEDRTQQPAAVQVYHVPPPGFRVSEKDGKHTRSNIGPGGVARFTEQEVTMMKFDFAARTINTRLAKVNNDALEARMEWMEEEMLSMHDTIFELQDELRGHEGGRKRRIDAVEEVELPRGRRAGVAVGAALLGVGAAMIAAAHEWGVPQ